MKFLNFILWPILLVCLAWISAIFFGPSIISSSLNYFSEGRIELSRVKVSPKLKIMAAVVDFTLPPVIGTTNLSGTSRAFSIHWKVRGGFEVFGTIGPTSLKEYGTAASTNFTLKPKSMFDWSEVNVQLEFDKLMAVNFEAFQASFTGNLVKSFQEFRKVKLLLPKVSGAVSNMQYETELLRINMDKYVITQPLHQQFSDIVYDLKQIRISKNIFEGSSIEGNIKLSNGEVIFKLSMADAELLQSKLRAKSLTMSSSQFLGAKTLEGTWEFEAKEILSKAPAMEIKKFTGQVKTLPSVISLHGQAHISKLEILRDQYFIGEIENGILDITAAARVLPSKIDLEGQGRLTLVGADDFNVFVSTRSALSEMDLFSCVKQKCMIDAFRADYKISTSGSSLIGEFECRDIDCFDRPLLNVLQTDNTNQFFQELSGLGILNPLLLPIAYLAVSGGEVLGDGHVFNF